MTINLPPIYYISFIYFFYVKHYHHRRYYGWKRAGRVGQSGTGGEERDEHAREGWVGQSWMVLSRMMKLYFIYLPLYIFKTLSSQLLMLPSPTVIGVFLFDRGPEYYQNYLRFYHNINLLPIHYISFNFFVTMKKYHHYHYLFSILFDSDYIFRSGPLISCECFILSLCQYYPPPRYIVFIFLRENYNNCYRNHLSYHHNTNNYTT